MRLTTNFLEWLRTKIDRRAGRGERIAIRAIRPDDDVRLVRAFQALDSKSIYQRFFFPKRDLSDLEVQQLTQCDGVRMVVLVATVGSEDNESIVGLGQYARRGTAAEVAFAVAVGFQGRGIASRLLRHLVHIARTQGVARFEAEVLADNRAMLTVFRHSGLPVEERRLHGVVHASMALTWPAQSDGAPRRRRWRLIRDLFLTTSKLARTTVPVELPSR